MFCGIEYHTVGAANLKALQSISLAVRGTCKRLSEEERRGLGGMLKFIGDERYDGDRTEQYGPLEWQF